MALTTLFELLHVSSVLWLVSGLAGRALAMSHAARATDIRIVQALVGLAGRFEMLMVRPSTFVVLFGGLATAWTQGMPILGALKSGGPYWVLVSLTLFLSFLVLIPTVFIPRGVRFRKVLQEAVAQGRTTPELGAAFADPVVAAAHAYEWIGIAVLTTLMITRPF